MGLALAVSLQLTDMHCGKCGGFYAIDEMVRAHHEKHGEFWHCPYCQCSWGYSESEATRARKELAAEKQRHLDTLSRLNDAAAERDAAKRKLRRVTKGVCPCCKRSFACGRLERHIKTKHPEFKP